MTPPEILGPKKFTRGTLMICPKFEILGGSSDGLDLEGFESTF